MVSQKDTGVASLDQKALYEVVGRRLREARREMRLTQGALAESVGLSRTSLTNIEKGRQKILVHTLFALATALQIPASELLPESERAGTDSLDDKLPSNLSAKDKDRIKRAIGK
jgi:transcriptional regulator with XRE-family HTH domain